MCDRQENCRKWTGVGSLRPVSEGVVQGGITLPVHRPLLWEAERFEMAPGTFSLVWIFFTEKAMHVLLGDDLKSYKSM